MELIEFKAYSTPTCFSIPLRNFGRFFQKMSITWNLGQNCWDEIDNLFSIEKILSPQNTVVGKVLDFWPRHLARFNIDFSKSMLLEPDSALILANQCCWQIFRILTTTLGHIQHWYWQINVLGKILGFWQQHLARFNIDNDKSMLLAKF